MNKKFILLGIIGIIIVSFIIGGFVYLNKKDVNVLKEKQGIKQEDVNLAENQKTENQVQNKNTYEETQEVTPESEKTFTMAEVEKHNSKESCWSVIRGKVYDLTDWINKHPGGADKILNICGKDGTEIFEKVHGGKEKPENALKNFEIGVLSNY